MKTKPKSLTITLDFDGVCHLDELLEHSVEPLDEPVPGAKEFIQWALSQGHKVIVTSARAGDKGGIEAIENWLESNEFPEMEVTAEKVPSDLYIDDRGFRFEGDWGEVKEFIQGGEVGPWMRKGEEE